MGPDDFKMQSITGTVTKINIGCESRLSLDEWRDQQITEMVEIARLNALNKIFSQIFGITECNDFVIDEFDRPLKIRETNLQ